MNKIFAMCVLLGVMLVVSGCYQEESPYLVESTIDLQSPNGIYETLLYKGAQEAFNKIEWSKYKDKKIIYSVQEINNGYLDNVVRSLVDYKFIEVGGSIVTINKSGENKDKPEREIKEGINYDYDVAITVPVSGVYYYEGFLRRNYVAYVMINLFAKQKNGSEYKCSSGIIEKKFDKFIPSKVCIVGLWVLLLAIVISIFIKFIVCKK